MCVCAVPVKSLDTYSFQGFFIFYYFLHCRIIVKTSKLWYNTYGIMSYPKKSVKQIKIYFRFFNVVTLCLDDSFAHSWHSLNQHHLECFSNSLEGVPTYAEHMFGWVWVIVEARSSDAALHYSPSWANSLTRPGGVVGHCPVEKQMIGSLSANQMGWRISAECCGSHAGYVCLEF